MANTLTLQTIADNERKLVVKAHLDSDGTEETGLTVINAANYSPPFVQSRLVALTAIATGNFGAALAWEADANVRLLAIAPDAEYQYDFSRFGGLPNNAGVGKTGNILLITQGIANNDELTLVFELDKDLT